MDTNDLPLIKGLIAKINAIEKTILNSSMKDEYITNRKEWYDKIESIYAEANTSQDLSTYLKED